MIECIHAVVCGSALLYIAASTKSHVPSAVLAEPTPHFSPYTTSAKGQSRWCMWKGVRAGAGGSATGKNTSSFAEVCTPYAISQQRDTNGTDFTQDTRRAKILLCTSGPWNTSIGFPSLGQSFSVGQRVEPVMAVMLQNGITISLVLVNANSHPSALLQFFVQFSSLYDLWPRRGGLHWRKGSRAVS